VQLVIGVLTGGIGLFGDRNKLMVLLGVLALALALGLVPATAFAADPATQQYNSSLEQLPTGGAGNDCPECVDGGGGGGISESLPFTGLDVAVLAVVAAVMLAAGLALRRRGGPGVES